MSPLTSSGRPRKNGFQSHMGAVSLLSAMYLATFLEGLLRGTDGILGVEFSDGDDIGVVVWQRAFDLQKVGISLCACIRRNDLGGAFPIVRSSTWDRLMYLRPSLFVFIFPAIV